MEETMERVCIRCGTPLQGRADKKFCCDDCRTDYHNGLRRQREKGQREINRILSNNWKILSARLRNGERRVSVAELAAHDFNFEIYTTSRKKFPGMRIYGCYNLAYRISLSGIVHIFPIFEE